jgi:uncharacterized repeat protein (TIGR03803 family)
LTVGQDGNFYGVASGGGAFGLGTAFRLNAQGDLTVLHAFSTADNVGGYGRNVVGPFVQGDDGNFYAVGRAVLRMTLAGDVSQFVTPWEIGLEPFLMAGRDGRIYGSGVNGMPCDHGDIFSFSLAGDLRGGGTGIEGCGSFWLDFQTVDLSVFGTFTMTEHCCPTTVVRLTPDGVVANPTAFPAFSSDARLTDGGDGYAYGVTFGSSPSDPGSIFKMSILGTPKPPTNVRLTPG